MEKEEEDKATRQHVREKRRGRRRSRCYRWRRIPAGVSAPPNLLTTFVNDEGQTRYHHTPPHQSNIFIEAEAEGSEEEQASSSHKSQRLRHAPPSFPLPYIYTISTFVFRCRQNSQDKGEMIRKTPYTKGRERYLQTPLTTGYQNTIINTTFSSHPKVKEGCKNHKVKSKPGGVSQETEKEGVVVVAVVRYMVHHVWLYH